MVVVLLVLLVAAAAFYYFLLGGTFAFVFELFTRMGCPLPCGRDDDSKVENPLESPPLSATRDDTPASAAENFPPCVADQPALPILAPGDPNHINRYTNRPYTVDGIVPWTGRPPVLRGPQPPCMVPTYTRDGKEIPREERVMPGPLLYETPLAPSECPPSPKRITARQRLQNKWRVRFHMKPFTDTVYPAPPRWFDVLSDARWLPESPDISDFSSNDGEDDEDMTSPVTADPVETVKEEATLATTGTQIKVLQPSNSVFEERSATLSWPAPAAPVMVQPGSAPAPQHSLPLYAAKKPPQQPYVAPMQRSVAGRPQVYPPLATSAALSPLPEMVTLSTGRLDPPAGVSQTTASQSSSPPAEIDSDYSGVAQGERRRRQRPRRSIGEDSSGQCSDCVSEGPSGFDY